MYCFTYVIVNILHKAYNKYNNNKQEIQKLPTISCLTTMYKTLTGILLKRISIHLEEQGLMPVEQKECHRGSKGCNDQV
jgi:hypothetical protein